MTDGQSVYNSSPVIGGVGMDRGTLMDRLPPQLFHVSAKKRSPKLGISKENMVCGQALLQHFVRFCIMST